jgi:putative SOS response-associated peptidase YedK
MCGRYVQTKRARDHAQLLVMREEMEAPRPETWNLAPSTRSLVILAKAEILTTDWLSWGFQRSTDPTVRPNNARVETARSKPFFRDAWNTRRCIIPADGWYEWKSAGGAKQPYYFHLRNEEPLFFAGIWEGRTFALLTTSADGELSLIHDRRPLALELDHAREWITEIPQSGDSVSRKTVPAAEIAFHPVSTRVNKPSNDGPELVQPIALSVGPSQADLL